MYYLSKVKTCGCSKGYIMPEGFKYREYCAEHVYKMEERNNKRILQGKWMTAFIEHNNIKKKLGNNFIQDRKPNN